MRAVVSLRISLRSDKSATLNFSPLEQACSTSLVSRIHSSAEGTHIVEENTAPVRWHVVKFSVCTCFPHRLREDRSATIKPCLCEFVFRCGTVHLVRVRMKFLYCLILSNSRIGNSFRHWWRHVTSAFSIGSRTWYDILFVPVITSLTRLEGEERGSSSSRVDSWYHVLTLMVLRSIPAFSGAFVSFSGCIFSSSNTNSMLCRENARAS